MLRILIATGLLATAAATPAAAQNIRVHVAMELKAYGFFDVDVNDLTMAQIAQIEHLIHGQDDEFSTRAEIAEIIDGGELQGFVFGRRR